METFINNLRQVGQRLKETWSRLTLNQKVLGVGVVMLLIISLLILFFRSSSGPAYETLYTDLQEKDAAAIVNKLEEEKIEYKLEDNGTTILVPSDYKYSTRLKLAGENLPRGQAGFELFHESGFGETQTDKKVKYQEALQGELARTIQALDKVKAANVMLALPEQSLFSDNEQAVKASVVVRTNEGDSLTTKEVQGIIHLVSNSVERLDPENVVIVDQYGHMLSENLPDSTSNMTEVVKMQMAMKKDFEKEKEKAIQTMLDKTLGKDNSVVRVNAELNFDSREQKDEKYTHDDKGPFVRSEEIIKESGTDSSNPAAGIPGTDNNIPQYTETDNQTASSNWDKSSKTRNYELNRTETVTKFSVGDVNYDHLTVSVLVNNTSAQQAKLGESDEEKIANIRSIVATACGLKGNRLDENVSLEDSISVAFIDFYTQPQPEEDSMGTLNRMLASPKTPWAAAALSLAIILVLFIFWRRRHMDQDEPESSEFEAVVEDEIRIEDLIDKNLTPEEKEKQKIKMEIDHMIEENPENAAQVVKTWLAED
ncbi:flagellar basal-body MS-ring/collar protein FliF [Syntrophomonas erecta]